jgi:hypothetical protein
MPNSTSLTQLRDGSVQILVPPDEMDAMLKFLRDVVSGEIPVSPKTRVKAAIFVIERSYVPSPFSEAGEKQP